MEIEILKEKETPLLSRRRITAMAYYEGATPSRIQFLAAESKELKADPKLVSIRHIYTRFGSTRAKLIIHQYMDRESYERLEGKRVVEKHKIEEAKAAEEPTEAKKEEKPAEEAKAAEEPVEAKKEEKPAEEAKATKEPAEDKKEEAETKEEPAKEEEKPAKEADKE